MAETFNVWAALARALRSIRRAVVSIPPRTIIHLVGQADRTTAVKQELMREGVPGRYIIVVTTPTTEPLPRAADGPGDPAMRKVEMWF